MGLEEIKGYAIKENINTIREALIRIEYFLNYKEINSANSQEIIKVNPSSDTVSDNRTKKLFDNISANDTKTLDTIHKLNEGTNK